MSRRDFREADHVREDTFFFEGNTRISPWNSMPRSLLTAPTTS